MLHFDLFETAENVYFTRGFISVKCVVISLSPVPWCLCLLACLFAHTRAQQHGNCEKKKRELKIKIRTM